MTIAIEPITLDASVAYGSRGPSGFAVGTVIGVLVGELDSNRVSSPIDLYEQLALRPTFGDQPGDSATPAQLHDAEVALHIRYVVRGTIEDRAGKIHARLEVVDVGGGPVATVEASRPSRERAALFTDVAERIARIHDPGATLSRERDSQLARKLAKLGEDALARGAWYEARPYLEQAVEADPALCEPWGALADVRAWMFAPEEDITSAIDTALRCTPAGPARALLDGESRFYAGDYGAAIAALAPLDGAPGLNARERRDLAYYLGESHWHDGDHTEALGYFEKSLSTAWAFTPAMIHPME
jgi:tetratricopeptide (TPR) repeat protein